MVNRLVILAFGDQCNDIPEHQKQEIISSSGIRLWNSYLKKSRRSGLARQSSAKSAIIEELEYLKHIIPLER